MEKHLIQENPFSNKELSKITTEDIDAFYNLKIDEGYSTSYIRKMHQMLHQAFSQAIKWEKFPNNPVLSADPPSIKKEEMKIRSFDEIHAFLNSDIFQNAIQKSREQIPKVSKMHPVSYNPCTIKDCSLWKRMTCEGFVPTTPTLQKVEV